MRDILFRGKLTERFADAAEIRPDLARKEIIKDGFVYGSLVVSGDKYFICTYAYAYNRHYAGNADGTMFEVDPETVGQFTGLTDKNGVRIFEGDMLEVYFIDKAIKNEKKINVKNTRTVLVEWINGSFCTKELYRNYRLDSELEIITEVIYDFKGTVKGVPKNGAYYFTEVIGNIYDNPELMKGGEANA